MSHESSPKLVREDKRAAALRENLMKRKTQMKERTQQDSQQNEKKETNNVADA